MLLFDSVAKWNIWRESKKFPYNIVTNQPPPPPPPPPRFTYWTYIYTYIYIYIYLWTHGGDKSSLHALTIHLRTHSGVRSSAAKVPTIRIHTCVCQSFFDFSQFFSILAWTNLPTNTRVVGDVRRHDAHVTSLYCPPPPPPPPPPLPPIKWYINASVICVINGSGNCLPPLIRHQANTWVNAE